MLVVYLIWAKSKGVKFFFSNEGLIYATIGGIMIGLASITFIKMFSTGSNLSIGVAVVRVGMVILAVLLGIFLLQEKLEVRQILGIVLSLFGLGLILFK